jgi:hypothetical protein
MSSSLPDKVSVDASPDTLRFSFADVLLFFEMQALRMSFSPETLSVREFLRPTEQKYQRKLYALQETLLFVASVEAGQAFADDSVIQERFLMSAIYRISRSGRCRGFLRDMKYICKTVSANSRLMSCKTLHELLDTLLDRMNAATLHDITSSPEIASDSGTSIGKLRKMLNQPAAFQALFGKLQAAAGFRSNAMALSQSSNLKVG